MLINYLSVLIVFLINSSRSYNGEQGTFGQRLMGAKIGIPQIQRKAILKNTTFMSCL
jgi:hypothetical protein